MQRIVCQWSGTSVQGNAVTVLHFMNGGPDPSGATLAAFQAIASTLPSGVTIEVPSSGDIIDEATGQLTNVWDGPSPGGTVTGSASNAAAAGVGAVVTWDTGGIVNGKRVRGRTFLVPLATAAYEADGTISASYLNEFPDFANALIGAQLCVWHRPTTPGGSDGSNHEVTSFRLPDKVAILTSRRD